MPSEQHKRLVEDLVKAGAQTALFTRRVRDAVEDSYEPGPYSPTDWDSPEHYQTFKKQRAADADVEWKQNPNILPDAFAIDTEKRTVTCYEVVVTGPVTDSKMGKYVEWWWWLDENGWSLELVVVDAWNNRTPVDLFRAWYEHEVK